MFIFRFNVIHISPIVSETVSQLEFRKTKLLWRRVVLW